MSKLKDIIKMAESCSYDNLLDVAVTSIKNLLPLVCRVPAAEGYGVVALCSVIGSAIGADGYITKNEIKFLFEAGQRATGNNDPSVDIVLKLIDSASDKVKVSDFKYYAKDVANMLGVDKQDVEACFSLFGKEGESISASLRNMATEHEDTELNILTICVLAVDGDINRKEIKFYKRML